MQNVSNVALVPHCAIWHPDVITPARLKAGTLLFDKLLFVNKSEASLPDYILSYRATSGRGESVTQKSKQKLSDCWASTIGRAPFFSIDGDFGDTIGHADFSKWPWDSAPDVLKDATKSVIEKLYQTTLAEDSQSPAGYEAYKYGGYLMSDIIYWRQFFADATFLGDNTTEDILSLISQKKSSRETSWAKVEMPWFDALTWDNVAELRQSEYLSAFRIKFFEIAKKQRSDRLMDEYHSALERLADYCRPNVIRTSLLGVLANIPGLPINPVSIAASTQAVVKDLQLKSKFGWAFFVRDVQRSINRDDT